MSEKKMAGLNVVVFESRLSKTLADLVALQGGVPFPAPAMKEVPFENNREVFRFAEPFFKNKIDLLILLTGVGTRALMSALETRYEKEKILQAFRKTPIVPRGPKPIKVLGEWQVPYALTVPEPNTWRELLDTLDKHPGLVPLKGRTVAVQEYGVTNPQLLDGLRARGAEVLPVPVYRWALPDDTEPLKQAIQKIVDGGMDVALFTTAVQVEHLLLVARTMGLERQVVNALSKMAVASVGPDTSEALKSRGIPVDIQPESPKMGPLVIAAAARAKSVLEAKREEKNCAVEAREGVLSFMAEVDRLQESPFLKACRLEKTPYTPVWLMRQAGRYMKDYRALREKHSFLALCRDKDLVTEITVTAQEKINADAAIIFSDILLLIDAWGLGLEYTAGDGPVIRKPVVSPADVARIPDADVTEALRFVLDAVRQTRSALKPNIPLLGFSGAPFTLASYMIEGGASRDFTKTKRFMKTEEEAWAKLLGKIVRANAAFLKAQAASGAQAVQIFDSWAGCLDRSEYEKFVLPFSEKLISEVQSAVPVIHFGTGTGPFLDLFSSAGSKIVGVDHRIGLKEAWEKIGEDKAVQGNLDPSILLKKESDIKKAVKAVLKEARGRRGHIFNLGHGVLPETPVENVLALVEMVHELSRKQ